MPWANDAQRRACYARRAVALSKGVKPTWDCDAYGKHKEKETWEKTKTFGGVEETGVGAKQADYSHT